MGKLKKTLMVTVMVAVVVAGWNVAPDSSSASNCYPKPCIH
ncbi:hypothetical protein VQL36_04200 [Chengkuizengella sp. SCS-71B]